ncbi:uncharacterized protein N7469_010975 [Penicillium citrinum]|uniref:ASST-domain-containing protein n=1 Tax=Penicillium citrinum TaxID=5077 RepID=A0A9W9NLQ6_PENCI|nr:uncharacterized protein N7469_010975 [Penicillium citrinum]KAJ5222088.1 hypothetical protein N7469_010975 [Penicillium citrinum]
MAVPLLSWVLKVLFCTGLAYADEANLFRSEGYANGFDGHWPVQSYRSAGVFGPILNYWQDSPACKNGQYTILAPRGDAVQRPGPMILDEEGHLVWFKDYPTTYNANVYLYKGEPYLTFWAGDDSIRGHGDGTYYMINSHYEESYRIRGANGLPADLHDFHITSNETAVFTIYDVLPFDLRDADGPENGWIYDGVFQEVNIETNELLFQWRASDHISLDERQREREGNGDDKDHPWDFYHINSIDRDELGNFLVSSRYMGSLAYIDGKTGNVLWKLGGKQNSFQDLSDGAATNISWQHHARFQPAYDTSKTRAISIFDNASRGYGAPEHTSRGLFIEINEEDMTAEVIQEYWNPEPISSQSQGSMQILDNGNVLVGYGYNSGWTEFSADGEAVCEVHFGPRSGFQKGHIISYRIFKSDWVGLPLTRPDVALTSSDAAVSWNGATEVMTWVLEGAFPRFVNESTEIGHGDGNSTRFSHAEAEEETFDFILAVPKSGFETAVPIPADTLYTKLRILALDKAGGLLGTTQTMDWELEKLKEEIAMYPGEDTSDTNILLAPVFMFAMGFVTASIVVLSAWLVYKYIPPDLVKQLLCRNTHKEKEGQMWKPVSSVEELDALSDVESGNRPNDSLLNRNHED